jgi:perosamine synthetase
VAGRYADLLASVDGVEAPLPDDADHRRSWFVYVVLLAPGIDRDDVIAQLAADGVASKPYLPSIHLQPYWRERYGAAEGLCPLAEDASARSLALPFHTGLQAEDQERVVEALARALGRL